MNTSHNKNLLIDDGWWNTIRNTIGTSLYSLTSKCKRPNKETSETKVYVISKSELLEHAEPNNEATVIVEEQPSTSCTNPTFRNKLKEQKNIAVATKQSSETDDDSLALEKSYRISVGEEILKHMKININEEKSYLYYLRQLSRFEELLREKGAIVEDFQIEHISEIPIPKVGRIKNSNLQANFKTNGKTTILVILGFLKTSHLK